MFYGGVSAFRTEIASDWLQTGILPSTCTVDYKRMEIQISDNQSLLSYFLEN